MNSFTRWKPAHGSTSTYQSSDFQTRHIATLRAESQKGDKSGSWVTSAAGNQAGAFSTGKGRRKEEETVLTHPLEVFSSHPSSLDSTLQHIVQQLDILTQVSFHRNDEVTLFSFLDFDDCSNCLGVLMYNHAFAKVCSDVIN